MGRTISSDIPPQRSFSHQVVCGTLDLVLLRERFFRKIVINLTEPRKYYVANLLSIKLSEKESSLANLLILVSSVQLKSYLENFGNAVGFSVFVKFLPLFFG